MKGLEISPSDVWGHPAAPQDPRWSCPFWKGDPLQPQGVLRAAGCAWGSQDITV